MLSLQIRAPVHLVLELAVMLFQDLHRFRIGHMGKIRFHNMGQPVDQALIHKLVEKLQILRTGIHYIADNIFHHIPGQIHVVV